MSYYDQYKNATFAQDYQTPDWYRQNFGIGIDGNGASMDAYFATHPAEAADFQRITSGQTSQMSTNGSTLLKTPFANMSQDAQGYYSQNPNAQLAAEGFGMDPTLAYMNYTQGPGSIGIKDPKNTNSTSYMRDNRWTPNGIQGNNNSAMYAAMPFGGGGGVQGANSYSTRPLQVDAQGNPIGGGQGQSGVASSFNQGVSGNNGVSNPTPGWNQLGGAGGGGGGQGQSGVAASFNQGVSGNNGVSNPTPGWNQLGGAGGGGGGGVSGSWSSGGGSMSSNFAMNPYLQQMGDMMAGTMTNNWQRQVQPQIASGAMAAGGYGGSRQGVVEANSANDLNNGIGSALASLYGNGYNTGLQYDLGLKNNQLGYANLDRNISNDNNNWQLQGANFGLGIYDRLQQGNQIGVNAGTNMQNTPQNYWNNFSNGANSIGQGYGTSTGTQNMPGSPVLGALGGAQLGGQIGNWWGSQSPNAAGGANSQGWGTGSGYGNQDYGAFF